MDRGQVLAAASGAGEGRHPLVPGRLVSPTRGLYLAPAAPGRFSFRLRPAECPGCDHPPPVRHPEHHGDSDCCSTGRGNGLERLCPAQAPGAVRPLKRKPPSWSALGTLAPAVVSDDLGKAIRIATRAALVSRPNYQPRGDPDVAVQPHAWQHLSGDVVSLGLWRIRRVSLLALPTGDCERY